MAGKSRSLSGIWVPVQLDTSKIEAQLSVLKTSFSKSIGSIQQQFEGSLNTKKFADQLVNIPKQIGSIRDAFNALKTTETAFDKPTQALKNIADVAGISEAKLRELYSQMATNQAITQQVNALTQLQKSLGMTAQETIRFAEANTLADSKAISAFASKNQIAGYQQLSTELQKIAPQAKLTATSFDQLNKEFTEFQAKQASLQYISGLQKSLGLDNAALKKYRAELNITEAELKEFIAQQKMASSANRGVLGIFSPSSISSAATSGLAAFGASLGAYGVAELTKSSFQASLALENIEVAFNSIYRDANKSEAALSGVRDIADRLGVAFLTASEGAKKMFASAQGTVLEDEVMGIFESITEAGVALRLDEQRMGAVFLAVSQSIGKGKIAAEELRSQLAEALPGAVQIFADSMGITTVQLDKMLEQGQVGIDTLIGFSEELSKRFGQGAAEASSSLQAELGRLSTSWIDLKASFSDTEFAANVVRSVTTINETIAEMQPQITTAIKLLGILGASLAATFVSTKVFSGISALITGIKAVATNIKSAALTAPSLGAALKDIVAMSPKTALLSVAISAIGYGLYKAFESKTPILDASKAMSDFSDESKKAGEALNDLANQNINNYLKSLENSLVSAKSEFSSLRKEIEVSFAKALSDVTKNFAKDLDIGFTDLDFELDFENTNVSEAESLVERLKKGMSDFEKGFSTAKTVEEISKLKEAFRESSTGIIFQLQELGVSAEALSLIDVGVDNFIEGFAGITQLELDIKKVNSTIGVLKEDVEINFKDMENSLKSLAEFGKKSNLAEALSLDVSYDNAIRSVQSYQSQLNEFKEDAKASPEYVSLYSSLETELANLYSRASDSPSEMASLNRSLEEIASQSEEARRFVDSLRQSLINLANQDIEVRVNAVGLDNFSDYISNKLPKELKGLSNVISSSLQASGVDVFSKEAKSQIDTLGSRLSEGLGIGDAVKGLSAFSSLTAESLSSLQKAYDQAKLYEIPDAPKKSTSSSTKTQSEAFKANEELYKTILDFEEQIRDSEYETFQVLEQNRQAELENLIQKRAGSAEEIAMLEETRSKYLGLYEQVRKLNEEEQAKEDASIRAGFYDQLGEAIGDTNLKMLSLNNTLAIQREEWGGLIPEHLINQLEYIQQLEISTNFFDGMKRGFIDIGKEAKDFASTAQEVVTSSANTMASSFSDFVLSSERSFSSLISSMLEGIAKVAVQAATTQFVNMIFGGLSGMFGGSSSSSIGAGSVSASTLNITAGGRHNGGVIGSSAPSFTRSVPARAFAGAPRFHNGGGYFRADEYPAILQTGERVLNRKETQAYHSGSSNQNVVMIQPIINNNNGSDVQTTSQTDSRGNTQLIVTISDMVAGQANKNGTGMNKAIKNVSQTPTATIRR